MQNHNTAAWNAGYRTAVGIHAGLVAAAEAVVDAFNDSHRPFEDRMLTLESALNNLMTHLADNERAIPIFSKEE